MFFEGLAGCVRERKMYQTHIKNEIKFFSKSIENRYGTDARESDAKIIENGVNTESKR